MDYENRVKEKPKHFPRDFAFIDKSRIRADRGITEAVAIQACKNFQPRVTGPFKILQAYDDTVVIDNRCIPESVPIDSAIHAQSYLSRRHSFTKCHWA